MSSCPCTATSLYCTHSNLWQWWINFTQAQNRWLFQLVTISRLDQRAVGSHQTVKCNFYYYFSFSCYFDLSNPTRDPSSHLKCELITNARLGSQVYRSLFVLFSFFFFPSCPASLVKIFFCNSCIQNEQTESVVTPKTDVSEMKPVSGQQCVNTASR